MAFLWSFSYEAKLQWKNWDWPSYVMDKLHADTRLARVIVGDDGFVYVLGQSHGWQSVFRWGAKDLNRLGNIVEYDKFTTAGDVMTTPLLYFARLNSTDGEVVAAQLVKTVDPSSNEVRPLQSMVGVSVVGSLALDEHRRLIIGAVATGEVHLRDALTVNSQQLGAYTAPEAVVLVTSSDLQGRHLWTTFSAPSDTTEHISPTDQAFRRSQVTSITCAHGTIVVGMHSLDSKQILASPMHTECPTQQAHCGYIVAMNTSAVHHTDA
jgi:hypothetical protein